MNCDDYAEELLGIYYHRNQLSVSQYATVCCGKKILTGLVPIKEQQIYFESLALLK